MYTELEYKEFLKQVIDAFHNNTPWMHTRYGDGEGIVIGYPEKTNEINARNRWIKWIGNNNIDMREFSKKIRESILYADIVGLPGKRHMIVNQNWRNVKIFIDEFDLMKNTKYFCCMDHVVTMHRNGDYSKILFGCKDLHYISCRDMKSKLIGVFRTDNNVKGFHLPLQHNPRIGKCLTDLPHYPDCYNSIIKYINTTNLHNTKWLVGAGGLGKIYCMEIKKRGGVVLDIGSVFDGWDGVITRSYLQDIIGNFKL